MSADFNMDDVDNVNLSTEDINTYGTQAYIVIAKQPSEVTSLKGFEIKDGRVCVGFRRKANASVRSKPSKGDSESLVLASGKAPDALEQELSGDVNEDAPEEEAHPGPTRSPARPDAMSTFTLDEVEAFLDVM